MNERIGKLSSAEWAILVRQTGEEIIKISKDMDDKVFADNMKANYYSPYTMAIMGLLTALAIQDNIL